MLVVKSELAPAAETIERVERRGKTGFSVLERDDLERFAPIEERRAAARACLPADRA